MNYAQGNIRKGFEWYLVYFNVHFSYTLSRRIASSLSRALSAGVFTGAQEHAKVKWAGSLSKKKEAHAQIFQLKQARKNCCDNLVQRFLDFLNQQTTATPSRLPVSQHAALASTFTWKHHKGLCSWMCAAPVRWSKIVIESGCPVLVDQGPELSFAVPRPNLKRNSESLSGIVPELL